MENKSSSNLVFSKFLTTSDFHNGLVFTTDEFLNYLKASSIDTVVVDPRKLHMEVVDENETWHHVNEWSRFVNEKNLEVGDLIELYYIDEDHGRGGEERRFKIMVTKPISTTRLFGETIGYFSP
ncbi:hypothetical protein ACFE04_001009 [Oxalis oulophora]